MYKLANDLITLSINRLFNKKDEIEEVSISVKLQNMNLKYNYSKFIHL